MIWDSTLIMGLVDAAIVVAVLAVMVVFHRHRRAIRGLGLLPSVAWTVLGLSAMALLYAGDLVVMFVLPGLTSPETAMAAMTALHLQWSWLASLAAVGCIAFGLLGLMGRLLPEVGGSMSRLQLELDARRRTEAALRESETRLEDAQRRAKLAYWSWSFADSTIEYWSRETTDLLGVPIDDFHGDNETYLGFVHPDDRGRLRETYAATAQLHNDASGYRIEYRFIRPDGTTIWIDEFAEVERDGSGAPLRTVGTIQDITERRRMEGALRESEARLRAVIENAPVDIAVKDLDGRHVLDGRRSGEMFGMPNADVIGKTAHELFPPALADSFVAHDRAVLDSGQASEVEDEIVLGGEVRTVLTVKFPITGKDGELVGIGVISTDITERKRAEAALREAHDGLERRVEERTAELRDANLRLGEEIAERGRAEAGLRRYQEFLQIAQGMAKIDYWMQYEPRATVTVESRWLGKFLGIDFDSSSLSDDAYAAFIHPKDRERMAAMYDGFWREGSATYWQGYEVEYDIIGVGGEVRTVYEITKQIDDDSLGAVGVVGTIQDITERKRAEEALRNSESRLIEAETIAHLGHWGWDVESNDLWWSDEIYRIFGFEPGAFEVTYDSIANFIHPDDFEMISKIDQSTAEGHTPDPVEYRITRPDGVVRTVEERSKPRLDDAGRVIAVSGTVQDVTERKQVEEEVRRLNARLSEAQALARMGYWDWDMEAGRATWSDEAYRVMGVEPEAGDISDERFADFVHPDDRDTVLANLRKTYGTGEPYNLDYRIVWPDGTVRYIEERSRSVLDQTGKVTSASGTIQDITERKLIEEEIRRLNEGLEQRVEERTAELRAAHETLVRQERLATLGQLTATVSHELRNPLGAMRSAIAVIRRLAGDDPPLLRESADIADRSISRCDGIISDLLDYTRIRPLNLKPAAIDGWLGRLLDEYETPAGITLGRELDADVEIAFDHERLRRTLINLMDNACQAMIGEGDGDGTATNEDHRLTIATKCRDGRLELMVGDTGPGVPPGERARIFEPLYSTKSFGVGLGLPIVRQIVELHGGEIDIAGEAGEGARFILRLPLDAPERRAAS